MEIARLSSKHKGHKVTVTYAHPSERNCAGGRIITTDCDIKLPSTAWALHTTSSIDSHLTCKNCRKVNNLL